MRQGALQAYQQVAALNLKVNFGHGLFASRRSLPVREHCRNAGGRWHWQRHECGRNRCVPLSLFRHPAVHHIRVQAMRQGHASYAGARLGAAFQHLCLELLAVLTPPWAVVIQRIFHRLHDPPSWGRCPLQAVFSRWDRQLHTHCLPSAKRQELGLTKAKMAQLLKVSGVSLYKWEKGSILPRSKQLDRVKVVLKMWPRQAQRAIAAE